MSEKSKEGAKEIEVTIKPVNGQTHIVKVDPNNKVSHLAKKVAEAFGFSKEVTVGNFKGFMLIHKGVSLASCCDEQITCLDSSSFQINLILVTGLSSLTCFDWNGELIKKEEEENIFEPNENKLPSSEKVKEEKEIVVPNENKSFGSDDKTEKESSWPWPRITLGVMDSILLAAAITSSILGLHIAISIVLIVLFVLVAIGVFGWKNLLPKRLQKGIDLKTGFESDPEDKFKNKEDDEKKSELEKEENKEMDSKGSKGEKGSD